MSAYTLSVYLHILAATGWIGSMLFFPAVIVPTLRNPEIKERLPALPRIVGTYYARFAWICLLVLIITGTTNLYFKNIGWALLSEPKFWQVGFGRILFWKLLFVVFATVATVVHHLLIGPRQFAAQENDPERRARLHKRASRLGRLISLLSLVILYYAVALVRGMPG